MWRPWSTYTRLIETDNINGAIGCIRLHKKYDEWGQFRLIQILVPDDASVGADRGQGKSHDVPTTRTTAPAESDRLSTILEETEETDSHF